MTSYWKFFVPAIVALLCVAFVAVDSLPADQWDDFSSSVRSAKRRYDRTAENATEDRDDALAQANDDYDDGMEAAANAILRVFTTEIATADDAGDAETELLLQDSKDALDAFLFPEAPNVKDILEGTWTSGDRDWTFDDNGTVDWKNNESLEAVDTGRWKLTNDGIEITWEETLWTGQNRWSVIHLPLEETGTSVDGWAGLNDFTITKKVRQRSRDRDTDETDTPDVADDSPLGPAGLDWDSLPESVRDAKIDYEDALLALEATRNDVVAQAQIDYLATLAEAYGKIETEMDDAIEDAEDRDNLDLADDLEDAKEAIEKASKGELVVINHTKALIGVWVETKETARGDGYDGRWKFVFKSDHTVTCSIDEQPTSLTGKWTLTDTHAIVTWSNPRYSGRRYRRSRARVSGSDKVWTALRLPLDEEGTTADSWSGMDAYVFDKVDPDD
jgi:hypothetical protein